MSISKVEKVVSPLILSYLQKEGMTTHQIADKLLEDTGLIPCAYIEYYIEEMREEHGICTEGDYHYIHQDKPAVNHMLTTLVIGGLFLCPILLNL